MSIFLQLAWFFRLEWRRYAIALSTLALVAGLVMIPPKLTGLLVDAIAEQSLTRQQLLLYCGSIALVALVVYVLRVVWRVYLYSASFNLAALLRARLYRHLSHLSPSFYHRYKTGDLMARATNDIEAVQMTAGEGVLALVDGLMTGVVVLAVMLLTISWQLTLVALLPWPVMAWLMYVYGNRLHHAFHEAQNQFSHLNDKVQETISGVRVVKAFGREQAEGQSFETVTRRTADANLAVARTDSLYDPTISLTVGASYLLSIGFGAWLVVQERLTLGQLTSFTMYLGFLIWPMFAFGWTLNLVERGRAAYRRIDELLQTRDDIEDQGQERLLNQAEITIDIKRFCYAGSQQPALENIQLQIPAGTTLGLVGHTGAGKTSLLGLLLRLYEGDGVEIALNGDNIRSFSLESLRRNIAFVPQDPLLFSATIAENIALGKPEASREEIEQVARLAQIHEDILRFPEGYDTLVGERGVTLSGGQKQRISIARALLLDAPILILDDALSAVDMETERQILAHLRQARVGRTTLIACHRLSAVEDAEQIAVLSHGQLAELGRHRHLQAQGGWYARMVEYQKLEQAVHEGR